MRRRAALGPATGMHTMPVQGPSAPDEQPISNRRFCGASAPRGLQIFVTYSSRLRQARQLSLDHPDCHLTRPTGRCEMNKTISMTPGKAKLLSGLLLVTAGCSTSTDNGPDCRYNEDWLNGRCSADLSPPALPSGIWNGTDSSGRDVLLLVSVGGTFQYVDASGNQGSGFFPAESWIMSGFELVSPLGQSFADGATLANCSFTGSLVERETIDLTQECTTSLGLRFSETLAFDFNPLYDRGSSLAAISGNYQVPTGNVLTVAADGAVFMQDAVTGCVTNGKIILMVARSNLYRVTLQHDSCTGPEAVLNGWSFGGFALLDDAGTPEELVIALIGYVADTPVSLFEQAVRL
jgi:hypothetical protein